MIRGFIFFLLLLSSKVIFGQDYESEVRKAGEAYDKNRFDSCALYFKNAFKIKESSGSDLYNAAICNTLAQNTKLAFTLLNKAIERGINISKLRIDPELGLLQDKSAWKKLMKIATKIQSDSFAKTQYPEYAVKLSDLWEADQYYRFRLGNAYKNNDTVLANSIWKLLRKSDSINLIQFKAILDQIGWPTTIKVGRWGAATAFLVIDHSPREVMEKYFPLLEDAAKKGEASMSNYATMKDRVLVNRGAKQIYGTQKYWDEKQGKFVFFPIEDEKKVNKLRKEVGLPVLDEFE